MTAELILLDVAPDPVSIGVVLAVLFYILGLIGLLAVALVVFLWYRKRDMRTVEMSRPASLPSNADVQPSNPNQP